MSRAFVREPDGDEVGDQLPDLPQEPIPNKVTPEGFKALEAKRDALAAERESLTGHEALEDKSRLAHVERDLRYYEGRIEHAEVIDPAGQPADAVGFGALVEVEDEEGHSHSWRIVGEDESDAAHDAVSWVSPLARALDGAAVGDVVTWKRPAGDKDIEVKKISYPGT